MNDVVLKFLSFSPEFNPVGVGKTFFVDHPGSKTGAIQI
jgi:hypothetical protein